MGVVMILALIAASTFLIGVLTCCVIIAYCQCRIAEERFAKTVEQMKKEIEND